MTTRGQPAELVDAWMLSLDGSTYLEWLRSRCPLPAFARTLAALDEQLVGAGWEAVAPPPDILAIDTMLMSMGVQLDRNAAEARLRELGEL